MESDELLSVRSLHVSYGGIAAVRDVSFDVRRNSLVAVIGSNGAGKSTTLNTIAGLIRASSGQVRFRNEPVLGRSTFTLARLGLALVPEGRMIAPTLTVRENLMQAKAARRLGADEFAERYEQVMELFTVLGNRAGQHAGSLSGGEQQMLAIGRALLTGPELLILDEPSMGLAPVMVNTVFDAVRAIHADGMTVLLVEQNAHLALDLCDHAFVMQRGVITHAGTPDALRGTDAVRQAFLG